MATPTLINLPPPPSNPETPSDMGPGTPNSGTTSLSALSTTAIKDGHKGHAPPHQHHHRSASNASASSTNTLDAERADRISRLAGLERVATTRQGLTGAPNPHAPGIPSNLAPGGGPPSGYFDTPGVMPGKERSTIGSASATGSAGGRTTWASGSDMALDGDKMSEDGVSSVAGMSDEGNASLVGFGEAANHPRAPVPASAGGPANPMERVRNIDGITYDPNVVDTATRPPQPPLAADSSQGSEMMVDEEPKRSPDMDRSA